jgi:hypothetical protein
MKDVKCITCGKAHRVSPKRAITYKCCSLKCYSQYKKSLTVLNATCTQCSKPFHLKESQIKRYNRTMGIFCSMSCSTSYKKNHYLGINNPNYRGAQLDSDGYRIHHYPKVGRMKEHHHVAFKILNIKTVPKGYCIHHRDCNIYNNTPENLVLLNGSDHRWLHKQFGNATLWAHSTGKVTTEELIIWSNNPIKSKKLLDLNILHQSGVIKQGELLGTPTPIIGQEDNQQPSLSRNTLEGSETNSRVLTSNVEDGNTDTSALLL